jgi:hypothetical protein
MVAKPKVSVKPSGTLLGFAILSRVNHPSILLGTSSFTAAGWDGSFYPKRMRPADYLAFYAEHFHTVEVDSTFYAALLPAQSIAGRLEFPRTSYSRPRSRRPSRMKNCS